MVFDGVIFHYCRENKYSIHALLVALDRANVSVETMLTKLEDIPKASRAFRRPLVVFSFNTVYLVEHLKEIQRVLRSTRGIKVAGGSHPTGDPVGTLNMGFDYVFVGEGERSLPEFVHGGIPKGVVWKEDDEYVFTGRPVPVCMDDFPSFPWWRGLFSPIEIERGCLHACKYCETPFIFGRSRYRSVDSILEHVDAMIEKGKRDVRFISPNSFGYPDFFELVDRISKKPVRLFLGSFPSEVRPESVDEEKLKAIEGRVSNKRIIIGAQSGSERILEVMNRGHSVEDVLQAVELCRKHGFLPEVDFIFGVPGETEEDVNQTLKLMENILKLGGRIHAHSFLPLPGTPWEGAPAGTVPTKIRRFLNSATGRGNVYGVWEYQEALGRKIAELYRDGTILGLRGWQKLRLSK